jgi:EF hand domain-containing protein
MAARRPAAPSLEKKLREKKSVFGIGIALAVLVACHSPALAQSASRTDPLLNNGPPVWDANHDGIFTCEEWKKFMEQLFASADRNRDGSLNPAEFEAIKKADPSLADADFGYFDENQDGKISRKEFVEKPSVFILRFDRNGDCRVTPDELRAATTPQPTGGPQERPRDRFH